MTLWIPIGIQNEVIQHAWEARPEECCGLIAGEKGTGLPGRLIKMRNCATEGERDRWFSFDPDEQVQAYNEMDRRNEDPVAVYHSHVVSPAYPSSTDIQCAVDPRMHYLIVSLRGPGVEFRSFRIVDGEVLEEHIGIL